MIRYNPHIDNGLNNEQIKARVNDGLVNIESPIKTKSISRIILDNVLTLFNAINLFIAIVLFCVGSYRNMLFCGVVVSNLFIGIFQEIRAKLATDKLTLISQNDITVVRGGEHKKIKTNEVVLDDILFLSRGDCVVCDCIVKSGFCEANESLVTGESDPISKSQGEMLLSGSFIVSGSCYAQAENIGENHYASKISNGAKYIKKPNSQIMRLLKSIIKLLTIVIVPIGIILFSNNYFSGSLDIKNSVESTAAAVIGMIPEGLVLLVSTVLAVSVVRLSKKKVLVQELFCIETLARVDTVCLDKTGTITEARMTLEDIIYLADKKITDELLYNFTSCATDTNPTLEAIKARFQPHEKYSGHVFVPFSSTRKYSAVIKNGVSFYLGAGDILCPQEISKHTASVPKGRRILALCRENEPLCFIIIKDVIKRNAKNILEYFSRQGVDIKIISGDAPEAVSAVAFEAGVPNSDKYINTSLLKTEKDYTDAVRKYTIFGRVTPEGKETLIKAIQANKHTVAMVGDGVNDVLALKASDCSIAMANGSAAARNVSHLILLDSDFSALPDIVYEGRRSINNIKRSASLFLVKTLYTLILSIIYIFLNLPYPFIPIQLTLISTATIGIPSFILALEPSDERITNTFLWDILSKSIPAALSVVFNIVILSALSSNGTLSLARTSTLATLLTGFCGIYLLFKLCHPFNMHRMVLLIAMIFLFSGTAFAFSSLFEFVPLKQFDIIIFLILSIVSVLFFELSQRMVKFINSRIVK